MTTTIVESIRHRLRIHESEKSVWNLQVLYEPEYQTVELSGPGGKVNFDVQSTEKVILLLQRAIELRDGVGGSADEDRQ